MNRDKANALSKEAFKGKGFLPIPGMAIGMPEFDGGERFDLRAPYADEGWVDEAGVRAAHSHSTPPLPPPPPPPSPSRLDSE